MPSKFENPCLGLVIVTYNSQDHIVNCIESLLSTAYDEMYIVVVDNDSSDDTVLALRGWASGEEPFRRPEHWPFDDSVPVKKPVEFAEYWSDEEPEQKDCKIHFVKNRFNSGFAGGVNAGLRILLKNEKINHFWVLNPDSIVEANTPHALMERAAELGRFAIIGCRTVFHDEPDIIQVDGLREGGITGAVKGINFGQPLASTPLPKESEIDFIGGNSMLVSREFIEAAGLMDESYFLYFEETDWQRRRGDLPLGITGKAVVRHYLGASIGTGSRTQRQHPFSLYFYCRSMVRYFLRWRPLQLPFAVLRILLKHLKNPVANWDLFPALLRGLGGLPPPQAVRARLPEEIWATILQGKQSS